MLAPYKWSIGLLVFLTVMTGMAAKYGWWVPSDAQAQAEGKSLRAGSIYSRAAYRGLFGGK